jgi:hypothetical protein
VPTQLLIYKSAVPVSRSRHGDCYIESGADYTFSRAVNSVPLMAVEFARAANEFAIVFAGQRGAILPAVILGVRGNENLYLSADQAWGANYVPAFIRRYPFVFSQYNDRLLLCIDEEFPGFNRSGQGRRLFEEDGSRSAYLEQVLRFLNQYQAEFTRTQSFCNRLDELGLLEPMRAQLSVEQGRQLTLGGFQAVNRARLKELPDEKLADLARSDELELIYLHLRSMRNFEELKGRLDTALITPSVSDPPGAGIVDHEIGIGRQAAE